MLRSRAFAASWGSAERTGRGAASHGSTAGEAAREAGLSAPSRLGLWIALLWLSCATSASAQTPLLPLELVWKAPAECPTAAEVRAELARIARVRPGYSLLPLAAEAHVLRARDGFRVVLRTQHESRRGERTLEAADCRTLARSVTLVLALAFGPGVELAPAATQPPPSAADMASALARNTPDPTSNERAEQPNAGSPNAAGTAPVSAARENAARTAGGPGAPPNAGTASTGEHGARAAVRENAVPNAARNVGAPRAGETAARSGAPVEEPGPAAPGSDLGQVPLGAAQNDSLKAALVLNASGAFRLAPALSFAAAVGVRLRLGVYALEARALLVPNTRFDITAAIRGQLRALGGSLSLCRLDDVARSFELSSCAGARLVSLTASSTGDVAPASATAPWTALTAAAFLSWPRRYWLQLRIEAAISWALSRPRFVVEPLGDAHRVGLFVPELGFSLVAGL